MKFSPDGLKKLTEWKLVLTQAAVLAMLSEKCQKE